MAEFRGDQAEGLRRMLVRSHTQVIMLASGCSGVGKTSVAVNVAAVLAGRGLRVLLIDENCGPANITARLGLLPRFKPEQIARRECTLEEAMLPAAHGVTVLPVAEALRTLPALPGVERKRLIVDFGRLEERFDVVLVDTPCGWAGGGDLFYGAVHDTIVVSSAATRAITASYALIKRLRSARGQRRFHVLLNRVSLEGNARVILDNLTEVARSHLQTPVESLGCVPRDESLRSASAGFHPVVDVHPSSPSAARFQGIADSIAGWPANRVRHNLMDRFMQRVLAGSSPVLANAGV
jgi:flagellar biosynthesis protein FlhG